MLISVNMRCYHNEITNRDEFEVIPKHCPADEKWCVRGEQWVTDDGVEFKDLVKCYYYDYDSYMIFDSSIECNVDQ